MYCGAAWCKRHTQNYAVSMETRIHEHCYWHQNKTFFKKIQIQMRILCKVTLQMAMFGIQTTSKLTLWMNGSVGCVQIVEVVGICHYCWRDGSRWWCCCCCGCCRHAWRSQFKRNINSNGVDSLNKISPQCDTAHISMHTTENRYYLPMKSCVILSFQCDLMPFELVFVAGAIAVAVVVFSLAWTCSMALQLISSYRFGSVFLSKRPLFRISTMYKWFSLTVIMCSCYCLFGL